MPQSQDICTACGRSKHTDSTGSLTQWVLLCKCNEIAPQQLQVNTINICINCGRRIGSSRTGSFTQWIFRTEVCECTNPQAVARSIRDLSDEEYAGSVVDLSDIVQIDVDEDKFPVERFAPIEILGTTYISTVYLSIDKMLGTRVAVKCVYLQSDANLVRFQKEVRALAKLSQAGIVKVMDFAENEGAPYMVMEYIDGVTLKAFLKLNSRLSIDDTLTVTKQLSQTLSYCHSKNILHRDIKPENLLVRAGTEPVEIKLVDFGLACTNDTISKQTETLAGTPTYMAPDVGKGKPYDKRSEVYSLGCVMFEVLTGKPPYESDNALQLLKMHADADIPSISSRLHEDKLDAALENIVYKCLKKEPDDRFQSMDELHIAIEEYDSGLEQSKEKEDGESNVETTSNPAVSNKEEIKEEKPSSITSSLFIVLPLILLVALVCLSVFNSNTVSPNSLKEVSKKDDKFKPDYSTHSEIEHHSFKKGELVNLNSSGSEVNDAYLKKLLISHSPDLSKIVLDSDKPVDVGNLAKVFKTIKLKDATFANALCKPKYIRVISNNKALSLLHLHKPSLKDIEAIPRSMQKLTVVALSNSTITADHIKKLKGVTSLKHLRFNYCKIEEGAIAEISMLPVVNIGMANCSLWLEDLASLQKREDMQFLRMKACEVLERGKSNSLISKKEFAEKELVSEFVKEYTGDVINAPDSLLKVVSKINFRRINFENYLFTKSDVLRLVKIPALERIDFKKCVLEIHTKHALQEVAPQLKVVELYCITVEMEGFRRK